MTVKLPEKAGFAPTVQEWDALVRIAENLAAQVVQRDAESLKATFDAHEKINQLSGDLYGAQMALAQAQAERDAARAEVARLTRFIERKEIALGEFAKYSGLSTGMCLHWRDEFHALRQPAQAQQISTSDGVTWHTFGGNTPPEQVAQPAPAQGQGQE